MRFIATHCYDESLGVIVTEASGLAEPGDILALYNKLHCLSGRYHCRKALVDLRKVSLSYDSASVLYTLDRLEPLLCNLQIARVVEDLDTRQQLIQEYADKQKLLMRNFFDRQTALDWLKTSLDGTRLQAGLATMPG
ncbi:hypothetical protein [Bowmanella denitrificans]|uniref:hypothetical protein n=1 Tax=Bowmanella denitrificans TaxID=366582 RepID=UPI000C9984E2|nr:hypothetical protein [Bowmanella denitrificans]